MDSVASAEAKREEEERNENSNPELPESVERSVPLRVHDVIIQGNTRTKDSVIEAAIDDLKRASTLLEIRQGIKVAEARFWELGVFRDVELIIADGPKELPGTVNVHVSVSEQEDLREVNIGVTQTLGATSPSVEGKLEWKNLFGFAESWNGCVSHGADESEEFSAGVSFPRTGRWGSPVFARVYLESQDFLKFSSYKQQALGLALGLVDTKNHKLSYDLAWRTLTTDPSQTASNSVRRQLGHSLLSSIKYIYQVDKRDSPWRPTQGYAYRFITQLAGLYPDARSARFLRQEFDLRYALPLGLGKTALNLGISGGIILPWGKTSLADRIFMGGNSCSPIGSLGQLSCFSGFSHRGLGPSEPRRQTNDTMLISQRDALGGDLAFSAFADISFDLPAKVLRDAGIYGHVFACAGNLVNIQEKGWRNFSHQNFLKTFRTSVGCGLVIPPKILPVAIELNLCHVLKKSAGSDGVKATGLSGQINFKF